jgi:ABC-type phosphate transport system auxiliary subunit
MRPLKMIASALFVAVLCLLSVPAVAAEPANLLPAGVTSISIFVTLGLLCLVVGIGLRAFSRPQADLSINQPKK